MPLIDDDPPITRPRGWPSTRPPRCGSGSEVKAQLYRVPQTTRDIPAGIRSQIDRSGGPASSSRTRTAGSSLSLAARTQPADPAPTIT